jgi:hypothetical protein
MSPARSLHGPPTSRRATISATSGSPVPGGDTRAITAGRRASSGWLGRVSVLLLPIPPVSKRESRRECRSGDEAGVSPTAGCASRSPAAGSGDRRSAPRNRAGFVERRELPRRYQAGAGQSCIVRTSRPDSPLPIGSTRGPRGWSEVYIAQPDASRSRHPHDQEPGSGAIPSGLRLHPLSRNRCSLSDRYRGPRDGRFRPEAATTVGVAA